jgi:hypothetical protein
MSTYVGSKVGQAIMLLTCIPEILGSNLGWNTNCPNRHFCAFIRSIC